MTNQNRFDEIMDNVGEMPLEEQSMLVDLIKNRMNEKTREEIAANARKTRREYARGNTGKGTVSDLFKEIN